MNRKTKTNATMKEMQGKDLDLGMTTRKILRNLTEIVNTNIEDLVRMKEVTVVAVPMKQKSSADSKKSCLRH